jgi:hypothetical protein
MRKLARRVLRVRTCCNGTCPQVWVRGNAVPWEQLTRIDRYAAGSRQP